MRPLHRIVGFLFGFSLASSYAAYHLLDEYKQASAALQASVEELQQSTQRVRGRQCRLEVATHGYLGFQSHSEDRGSGEGLEGIVRDHVVEGGPLEATG